MKKYMIVGALLVSSLIFAQKIKPQHEIVGDLIKSTYYFDNGKISQEGFYKNGKVHGQWIAYDENGAKKSIGTFENGQKTGKWFFWNNNNLNEVDYSNSRITSVKNWKQDAIVNRN
jgi:antitoxin component YwqK of YwqJK toxin-antitoxin module